MRDIALGERNWPTRIQQIQNAYHNQFELPVLFYVLVALALITRKADMLFVVMSWMFVASRLVHAAIHTTSNKVSLRFMAFVVGRADPGDHVDHLRRPDLCGGGWRLGAGSLQDLCPHPEEGSRWVSKVDAASSRTQD